MLPSVYADIRGRSVMDWIEEHTSGAFFCRKSGQVKELKGGELNLMSYARQNEIYKDQEIKFFLVQ